MFGSHAHSERGKYAHDVMMAVAMLAGAQQTMMMSGGAALPAATTLSLPADRHRNPATPLRSDLHLAAHRRRPLPQHLDDPHHNPRTARIFAYSHQAVTPAFAPGPGESDRRTGRVHVAAVSAVPACQPFVVARRRCSYAADDKAYRGYWRAAAALHTLPRWQQKPTPALPSADLIGSEHVHRYSQISS